MTSVFYLTEPQYLSAVCEQMVADTQMGHDVLVFTPSNTVKNKLFGMGIGATLVFNDMPTQEEHDRDSSEFWKLDERVLIDNYPARGLFIDRMRFWHQHHKNKSNAMRGISCEWLYIQPSLYDSSPFFMMGSVIDHKKLGLFLGDAVMSQEGVWLMHSLSPDMIFASTRDQYNFAKKIKKQSNIKFVETAIKTRPKININDLNGFRKTLTPLSKTVLIFNVRYEWDFRRFLKETPNGVFYVLPANEKSSELLPHYLSEQLIAGDASAILKLVDHVILFGFDYDIISGIPLGTKITIVDYHGQHESWLPLVDSTVVIA